MLLALNGYCQGYQNGDPFGARWQGAQPNACGGTQNSRYDAEGYDFIIDFTGPSDTGVPVTGEWDLQIFEPGACDQDAENATTSAQILTTLWHGDDTLFSDDDNKVPGNLVTRFGSGSSAEYAWPLDSCGTTTNQWVKAYELDANAHQGRWVLRTRNDVSNSKISLNSFGLRVVARNTNTPCGALVAVSTCPQLYARSWLPIYIPRQIRDVNDINIPTFGAAATSSTFFLARVEEVHRGKTLEVKLFDPGEGMNNMQVLAPDNTRYPFSFAQTPEGGTEGNFVNNTDTCTVSGVSHNCLRVASWTAGDARPTNFYNGTELNIRIPIPNDYSCVGDDPATAYDDSSCWWRVRYEPLENPNTNPRVLGPVTDRTTWSIRVIGDPIRLAE